MRLTLFGTLTGRLTIVVAMVLLLTNMIAVGVYIYDRFQVKAEARIAWFADRIITISEHMERVPVKQRTILAQNLSSSSQQVRWFAHPPPDIHAPREFFADWIEEHLTAFLGIHDEDQVRVLLHIPPQQTLPQTKGRGQREHRWMHRQYTGNNDREKNNRSHFRHPIPVIAYRLNDHSWITMSYPRMPFRPPWVAPYVTPLLILTLVALILTVWAIRRAVAPMAVLAEAADRFGLDVDALPLSEKGPREVKEAAHAFNRMRDRLRSFVRGRTQMLAAISHDLRTPITRMRLRVELVEDEKNQSKMLTDLEEMEKMITSALDFARQEAIHEERCDINLVELLRTLCEERTDMGSKAFYEGPSHAVFYGAPLGLKRVFDNLLDNALKYGTCAKVSLIQNNRYWIVHISDNGPGIPEDLLKRVFDPFYRVESSRNRRTGGTGLGLAVARSIVQAHGGTIKLNNDVKGGLIVKVSFPIKS